MTVTDLEATLRAMENPPECVIDAMARSSAQAKIRNGHGLYGYRDMWRAGVRAYIAILEAARCRE